MGARSARITDVPAIRALARRGEAQVFGPSPGMRYPSAAPLALLSAWQTFGYRYQTVVLRSGMQARGFAQARACPGRESWDILRLVCQASDGDSYLQGCAELLERVCAVTTQRGALRTFVRVPSEGDLLPLITGQGFRAYASELTLGGRLAPLIAAAPAAQPDVRIWQPRDAWDVFSLYCAVTPALVRHAEGRSLREWSMPARGPWLGRPLWPYREVVMGEPGQLQAWLRWIPRSRHHAQLLEILARPEAAHRLGELLRFAAEVLKLDPECTTICRTREYDGRISATLDMAGFGGICHETLLVRHTVARVTERQLLIAALRAQGLGIDISQYRHGAEPVHQRLASSREAEQHHYDRQNRTCYY